MPYTIAFDANQKKISILVLPPISGQEGFECLRQIRSHPQFGADYAILFNMLAADKALTLVEATRFGEIMRAFFPKQKVAFVRHNPPVTQAFDVVQLMASPIVDVRIFGEMSEAEAWLVR